MGNVYCEYPLPNDYHVKIKTWTGFNFMYPLDELKIMKNGTLVWRQSVESSGFSQEIFDVLDIGHPWKPLYFTGILELKTFNTPFNVEVIAFYPVFINGQILPESVNKQISDEEFKQIRQNMENAIKENEKKWLKK